MRMGIALSLPMTCGAGSAAFTPASTAGVILWANAATVVGSPVSQWTDKTGNGNHLTAAGANQPAIVASNAAFGGKPTLTWNGTSTSMRTAGNITLGPFTMMMAIKCTAAGGYFATFQDDGADYFFTNNNFSSWVTRSAVSCSANLGASWGAAAGPRTLARVFDGTAAGHKIYANNVDLAAATAGSDPGVGTLTQPFFLGSNQVPASFAAFDIGDIVIANRALSTVEMGQIHTYFRGLYGY